MIAVAYRNTPWSEKTEYRRFLPGATIAEIVASFDTPPEFASHGGVYLKRAHEDVFDGHIVARAHWHRVRPKPGTALFISLVPQGGGGGQGGGDSGKNAFQVVAAIALIVVTAWIAGPSGVAFFAPVFGAHAATAATLTAAAVGVAGSAALSLLSKPAAGREVGGGVLGGGGLDASSQAPGIAGVSQNPISAYAQLPGVVGQIRISPPLLARPFTTIENNDEVLHMICGVNGRCSIDDIKINDTDLADLADGVVDYETREGADDDEDLTLVNQSVFQENVNLQLSVHRLEPDQTTLVNPYAESYPKPYIMRSARDTKKFRISLEWPSGLANFDNDIDLSVGFRIRIRRVGDSDWIKLPELHIQDSRRTAIRQEIWLSWGNDAEEDALALAVAATKWSRIYYSNSEWTAESYFDTGGSGAVVYGARHVYPGRDGLTVHLDEATFPPGQYDVEILRSFADTSANFSETVYTAGAYTYRSLSGDTATITEQSDRSHLCVIRNYASFRDQYPLADRNLALIAIKARNLQINSVSAVFGSYVNIWDGADWDTVAVSSNPAALLRHVLTGALNARPVPLSRLDDLSAWYDHCENEGLTCNHVVTEGSVEQAAGLIAQCGDAMLRRSDKWGVVVDKDRSAEAASGVFHPGVMTGPLTVTKKFVTSARALVPSYKDAARDFAQHEFEQPVVDDGYASSSDMLTEAVVYEGLTTEALVTRRARLDLRRARLRTMKYSFQTHLSHLRCKKGDLVNLAHDILTDTYGTGRVKDFTVNGGNIVDVTLNTSVADLPVSGYDNLFEVGNVLTLANLFALTGPQIGLQIELPDASVATLPISGVEGRTLTVAGTVAAPAGLKRGCLAAVGRRDRESRRVIIADIMPKHDFFAQIDCVDEAPAIFAGL